MTMSPPSIRCRGNWKIHKRASEPDRWLDEMGYFRKHTARDSSCLFRIVSENIFNNQRYFNIVRKDCVNFMATNRSLFEGSISCPFDNYLKEMSNPGEWGGFIEISAMSHLYRRDFIIFDSNKGPQTNIFNGYGSIIHLFYIQDSKHFDAVYTKEYINMSSFCQSLVYEVLYGGVFKIRDIPYAIDRMLHDKIPTNHIEYFMAENVERRRRQKERDSLDNQALESGHNIHGKLEENEYSKRDRNNNTDISCKYELNVDKSMVKQTLNIFLNGDCCDMNSENYMQILSAKNMLEQGVTPFPYKVAKALDPDIYRNIEFDVWSEMRREIRYGSRYTDGSCLQVGVKCLCRLQADQTIPYHCHIQEMNPDGGPCLVFIEELGEKKIVNYEHLEPLPLEELRPWAPPFRHSHSYTHFFSLSQMLQHLGNMTKKNTITKMRNKLKCVGEGEDTKIMENEQILQSSYRNNNYNKMHWKDNDALFDREKQEMMCSEKNLVYDISTITSSQCKVLPSNINLSAYHQLDYVSFEPYPVEITAMPQMEDHRDVTATVQSHYRHASDHLVHSTHPNVDPCMEHHMPQLQHPGNNELGGMPLTPPATLPGSAPVSSSNLTTYSGNAAYGYAPHFNMYGMPHPNMKPQLQAKPQSVLLCAPPAQYPPPFVNTHVHKSLNPNGSDLPMNDIPTLRYFFNLGVDCMWGGLCSAMAPAQTGPRVSPINELAQELQHNLSLQEHSNTSVPGVTSNGNHTKLNQNNKNPSQGQSTGGHGDKVLSHNTSQQGKANNGPRPPLGPRFKRSGGGGDNTQAVSNKNHLSGSKGANNQRKNSQSSEGHSNAAPPECHPEPVVPYLAYPPPPFYSVPYYPMEEGVLGYAPPPLLYAPLPEEAEGAFAAPYVYPPPPYYAPPAHLYLPTDQPSK